MTGAAEFGDRDGVALVTGGSGAMGAAVVRELVARGSRVALTYRSNTAAAQALVDELGSGGGEVAAWQLDLTDRAGAADVVGAVDERFGAIHTLVYASGPFVPLVYLSGVTPDQFAEQLNQDAVAFFNVLHPCIPRLRKSAGSVVALATTAIARALPRDGLSAGPKGAVAGVVRTLAREEGRFGVRANLIGVGVTTVGMAAQLLSSGDFDEHAVAVATAAIPLRRFGSAADIAHAACFLASDAAGFVTGQTLNVDGGHSV